MKRDNYKYASYWMTRFEHWKKNQKLKAVCTQLVEQRKLYARSCTAKTDKKCEEKKLINALENVLSGERKKKKKN